jgi:hypothetical protein
VARDRNGRKQWQVVACAALAFIFTGLPARPRSVAVAITPPSAAPLPESIFLVEHKSSGDLYSNGLQILSGYETTSIPRRYRTFTRSGLQASTGQTRPAGIVFHTTESLLPPIEADQLGPLRKTREDLLAQVRRERLYNFVIDRFGEVFRVVPEDQTAFHAGHSIWADSSSVFINLNESFLGVAFEMRAGESATGAQRHAGRLLAAMLRSAYGIPDGNCVTHAQVSVNPDNLRIGYHTDWGGGFPFADLGLAIGYSAPIAAVDVFGFVYDEHFLEAIGGRPWVGLLAAEQQILIDAGAHGMTGPRYRTVLQQQFQALRRHNHETK